MIGIRPMGMQDCEKVYEIARQTLPEHWSLHELCKVLQYDYNVYIVAYQTESEQIVGFAGSMALAEDAELLHIAVLDAYRKKGIGAQLLKYSIDCMKKRNAQQMFLEVRKGNVAAQWLYRQYGFEAIGIRNKYYSNPVEDAVIMRVIL